MKDSTYFALQARRHARNAALLMMGAVNLVVGGTLLHLYGYSGWCIIVSALGLALAPAAAWGFAEALRNGHLCARWRGYEAEGRLSRSWQPPLDYSPPTNISDGRPVREGRDARR